LRFALAASQDHGVWGGMSEEERWAIRQAQGDQAERLAG
jgi:hypothetical protein